MQSKYSKLPSVEKALLTLNSVYNTIQDLIEWNNDIKNTEDYYGSSHGMQLLAANCTLITAIGEGINRVNRVMPEFLSTNFPNIPWIDIIGMRNRIAHGYFELDADIVFDVIKSDVSILSETINSAISLLQNEAN